MCPHFVVLHIFLPSEHQFLLFLFTVINSLIALQCWQTFFFSPSLLNISLRPHLTNAAANELQNLHVLLATFSLDSHDPEVHDFKVTSTKPAYPFGFEHKPEMPFLVTTWNNFWTNWCRVFLRLRQPSAPTH